MAPKVQKGPKQILAMTQLTAFINMYKAACKNAGIAPDKSILEEAEKKLAICKPLDKIVLRGPQHGSASLCSVLDAMAGYPGIKNLVCWGCSLGDQGLHALAQLMRSSVQRTWTGSKPRLLEIVHDGAQLPPERWPERYVEQANGLGDMVTRGSGFQLPSLVMEQAQAVTLDTIKLQQDPASAAALDLVALERQLTNLMASTSQSTTTILYDQIATARATASTIAAGGPDPYTSGLHPADGRPPLRPGRPQPFSPEVLKEFSLALGTLGNMLTILVLDHNYLGDMGAKLLAPGLKRCAPLQQLSLACCGIGPEGAVALAASLRPDDNKLLADIQPKYKVLNLGHNPLCAAGLTALAGALIHLGTLKVLLLAEVDVGSEPHDLEALRALASCLTANPSIDQVDFDLNPIGDTGAAVLLPFLQEQKHIRKFRITPRLSRTTMQAVQEAVRANLPKKKVLKKKKVVKKF